MRAPGKTSWALLALLLGTGLLTSCGEDAPPPKAPPRPVETLTLTNYVPNPSLEVMGVAEPYREAEVSFEVPGRIISILDVGRPVEVTTREKTPAEIAEAMRARNATLGENPTEREKAWKPDPLVHTGDVIAQIEDTSYRRRVAAARLRLKTAQEGLKAQELDRDRVAPAAVARATAQREAVSAEIASAEASVRSAESNRKTTSADLGRNRKLLDDGRISKAEFDQYQNAYDNAEANLAKAQAGLRAAREQLAAYEAALLEAKAALEFKRVSVEQTRAQIDELAVAVQQAQEDLGRCILRAPFRGRITYLHASQGDFVAAGKPVLRLSLIDPIKVSVTVSAKRERRIPPGTHARVTSPEFKEFGGKKSVLVGTVFEKGAVADPSTRTFRIDVLVRNARRRITYPGAEDAVRLDFRGMLPAVERHFGEGGPLYVCRQCFVDEGEKQVLYRVKGAKFSQPRAARLFDGPIQLERIEMKRMTRDSADFMQILNWSFQRAQAVDGQAIDNGDLLINFQYLDPQDIERGVVLDRFDWAIRPGDLVPVTFETEGETRADTKGFWVPDDAIRAQNEKRSVFAVVNGKAREISVTPGRRVDGLRHIVGEGLAAGMHLIVVGVHYVFDGADVVVAGEADAKNLAGQGR